MSGTMHLGVISLLYKGKAERDDPKNWRPISLLNVDYKIFTKILTARLSTFMSRIIVGEQFCSVKGRDLQQAVRLIDDTLFYADSEKQPLAILSIDQQQAFDRVEWDFMFLIIEKLGIPQKFISVIKCIYNSTKVKSCVNVNGYISKNFEISRGIRQGCPLSALLYVIVQESFACAIRKNNLIHGMRIPLNPHIRRARVRHNLKMIAYADDMNLVITSVNSISEIFELADWYGKASGQKIGMNKTKLLCNNFFPMVYQNYQTYRVNELDILGYKFSFKGIDGTAGNWEKFNSFLQVFEDIVPHKNTSWRGRVNSIMTYGFSLFQFKSWNCQQYKERLAEIERCFSKFVFYPLPKRHLKIDHLYLPLNLGGINFPNLLLRMMSQKLSFLANFLNSQNEIWTKFFDYFNYMRSQPRSKIPSFYRNLNKVRQSFNYTFDSVNGKFVFNLDNKVL
jgi:hypothetical protein